MQITLTHNSELRLRKVEALYRTKGVAYPVSGDNHYPSIGEEVEVAKHTRTPNYTEALAIIFKQTQSHTDLKAVIDHMENQETVF